MKSQAGVRDSEGRKIPKKYLRGLSKKKQKQMKKEIKDFRDRPDDDAEAYEPWVADKGVKPKKKSKATKAYHKKFSKKHKKMHEAEERAGKWEITHKDLPRGEMLLISHTSGKKRKLGKAAANRMRLAIKRIEKLWDKGKGPRTYPNVHRHIDALLDPFLEDRALDEASDKGLAAKAKASSIPLSILKRVFRRGMAAWKTGHRPGVAQQQWAYGRVNSFITGSGGARKADADLWTKAKKSKKQGEAMDLTRTPLLNEGECDNRKKNDPWRTPGGSKKFAVCATDGGKTKLVRFGDPNLSIKRDQPERRKNFRARHNCAQPGPKTKAKYWACKTWEKKRTVKDVVGEGRTPLLIDVVIEQQPVPVDWPTRVGYPPPGVVRAKAYPAGEGKSLKRKKKRKRHEDVKAPTHDASYPCTKDGKKIAKAHAWQFPSKRVKVCGKILKY